MKKDLITRLNEGPIMCAEGYLFAMERRGYLSAGPFVPEVVLEHPEVVTQLHREFIRAGSEVVQAFTYYGHREKLRIIGKEHLLEPMQKGALKIAKDAAAEFKDLDLIELDQLLQTVGWSRRPIRRVKRALDFSILVVGLWRHDDKFPRLVGFARCTGDGILEATVWDVAINPVYQGLGLGKELMKYVLKELKNIGISKVTLFADAEVVSFYKRQGWTFEPRGSKCAFWYAN